MEYFPNGDLHKYLGSPLPEMEGQRIVSQILEGLDFMHDHGFAHRDLKPAVRLLSRSDIEHDTQTDLELEQNILVVYKGPDWWVKIADFGISKRAIEGLTALRTQVGTLAFAAPEVFGFVQSDNGSEDSYTNAVDIWSVGVITFLLLTGETLFNDLRRLGQYVSGSFQFPSDILLAREVSKDGCDFVRRLMAVSSKDRSGTKECLQHPWFSSLIEDVVEETQRYYISTKLPEYSDYATVDFK
jgi:serine/threonine protein kinase